MHSGWRRGQYYAKDFLDYTSQLKMQNKYVRIYLGEWKS